MSGLRQQAYDNKEEGFQISDFKSQISNLKLARGRGAGATG